MIDNIQSIRDASLLSTLSSVSEVHMHVYKRAGL